MTIAIDRWNDGSIGPGPIALSIDSKGQEGARDLLFAASRSSPAIVAISLEHFAQLLDCFNTRLFVSADVAAVHRRLLELIMVEQRLELARQALGALTREGRWVSLRLLDRQVRHARKPDEHKLRDWPTIVEDWVPDDAGNSAARDQHRPGQDEERGLLHESMQILNVFERLSTEASQLARESEPVPEPVFEIGLDGPKAEEGLAPEPARQTTVPPAPLGHRVEVWASVCLKQMPGLVVDTNRLRYLREAAHENYRSASKLLLQKAEVRDCLQWSGEEVARNEKGFPQYNGPLLAAWLNKALGELCDCQNRPADILRNAAGQPSLNIPEHWGIWPGCDNTLHAWRQVFRMADVARIARREEIIRPHYDMVPALSSTEPNLTVYRSLRVPVFEPRSGHIFVAGQLPELRARCLAAICVRRHGLQNNRLRNYLLWQDAPIVVAAAEMFTGDTIARSERGSTSAAACFSILRETDPHEADFWLRLTHALLETVPLGLPTSLLTRLLHNDYGLDMTATDVERLQSTLVEEVAYELQRFLEDATLDVVTARLGLGFKEGLRQLLNFEDPDTTGATLRNALQKGTRHPINQLVNEHPAATGEDPSSMPRKRRELFQYRGVSLAGRVTNQAASAAVRRAELLMSAEDVMLAVAHEISAAGYMLLGLTDSEFVLEVPVDKASEPELTQIARLAKGASRQILGVEASVLCETAKVW